MLNRKKDSMRDFFKKLICEDLDNDISTRILNIISKGYIIENISHSIYNIVKIRGALIVVIEVKCFDYELTQRRTGYFALEYFYTDGYGYRAFFRYSRSMPIEIKLAADVPYGGWFKDERQIAEEERHFKT